MDSWDYADFNEKQNLIHFHDDKGTLRLSIKFSKLYYIEAADNREPDTGGSAGGADDHPQQSRGILVRIPGYS